MSAGTVEEFALLVHQDLQEFVKDAKPLTVFGTILDVTMWSVIGVNSGEVTLASESCTSRFASPSPTSAQDTISTHEWSERRFMGDDLQPHINSPCIRIDCWSVSVPTNSQLSHLTIKTATSRILATQLRHFSLPTTTDIQQFLVMPLWAHSAHRTQPQGLFSTPAIRTSDLQDEPTELLYIFLYPS